MTPNFAPESLLALHASDTLYAPLLEIASAPLRETFGNRVQLQAERVDRLGDWVFVLGKMQSPQEGRPDYSDTPFAERASEGSMSDAYVALLRRSAADGRGTETDAENDDADSNGAAANGAAANAAPSADTTQSSVWQVVKYAIGPGDVCWLTWPADHGAPAALFGF